MADIVWEDDPVAADVERLAGAVEFVGELRPQEVLAAAARPVEHHHRIIDLARSVAVRLTQRGVVDVELGKRFARAEFEGGEDDVTLLSGPGLRGRRRDWGLSWLKGEGSEEQEHGCVLT